MIGETAGTVVVSHHPDFAVGQRVVGRLGWQEMSISDGSDLQVVDDSDIPLTAYLGAVGMTGITAWYGIECICAPKGGETVVVSGAAGAVGSVAVQLARERGCRVVGIAGGTRKCRAVVDDFGADACVDYQLADDANTLQKMIAEKTRNGVHAFFDNGNGMVLEAVLPLMNPFGRIALCGMIARYDERPMALTTHGFLLLSRLRAEGYIILDQLAHWPAARSELAALVRLGKLKIRETVSEGLASAPAACTGLLEGKNLGKQLVRLM
jgi:NADPH-dependent curcumin reductase CurA